MLKDEKQTITAWELRVSYGKAEILRGISFSARAGEFWGIIGPNASGKTTLLRCFAGTLKPLSGQVVLQGKPRESLKPREFAGQCSLLLDEMVPGPMPVIDYVLLARSLLKPPFSPISSQDRDKAEAALQAVELWDERNTPLENLSQGQLLMARIARVIAQDAPVLLLDEPTAHLDPRHAFRIMGLLAQLAREGKTVLAVLHDLSLATRYTDHILVIKDGVAAAGGLTGEVLTPELIREVFGVQARRRDGGIELYPE
ncbi:MAG: ABC transporter ATP-binding protein [candidate division WOR-3 bacterium]